MKAHHRDLRDPHRNEVEPVRQPVGNPRLVHEPQLDFQVSDLAAQAIVQKTKILKMQIIIIDIKLQHRIGSGSRGGTERTTKLTLRPKAARFNTTFPTHSPGG